MKRDERSTGAGRFIEIFAAVILIGLGTELCGCGTAQIAQRREVGALPAQKPEVIYVTDFELEAGKVKTEKGLLPTLPKAPGPLGDMLPPLPGTAKDPEVVARETAEGMSTALVKSLGKVGCDARRLRAKEPMPKTGLLVRGVFTEVNQGNQLRRAVIGFGAGKTDLQVLVVMDDLGQGAPRPFYELKTAADSGRLPGAGPMIVLMPAGAAARFVVAGGDLDRNVKQTATKIAAEVVQHSRARQQPTSPGDPAEGRL